MRSKKIFLPCGAFLVHHPQVFRFFTKRPQKVGVPVDPIDRLKETHARVVEVKALLDALDNEMRVFKSLHKIRTDRFSRLLGVESPGIGGFAAIDAQWRELLRRRDRLVSAWHEALRIWSEVKETAKNEKCAA